MRNPAIVLHDAESVRQLGPVGLKPNSGWSQDDSDTIAHFLQVQKQLATSTWLNNPCRLSTSGNQSRGEFPDIESFVYAAVYFRQLFCGSCDKSNAIKEDLLFIDTCDRYIRSVDSIAKASWMHHEKEAAIKEWGSTSSLSMIPGKSTKQVFEALLYGSHLMHSIRDHSKGTTRKERRDNFRDILNSIPRERMLYELHTSLREMLNYVTRVARVIYQDYSSWLQSGASLPPDVMWHESVFRSRID